MTFSIFGSTFGFAFPAALLAFPLGLTALVIAYRNRGRLSPVPVASTLLLKLIESKRPARQSFFPPMRFFFELLALLVLTLAAAGLREESGAKKIALIVDDSFSTAALDPRSSAENRVFEQIKLESLQFLAGISATSKIDLFSASQGSVPLEKELSPSLASQTVRSLSFSWGIDSVESSLNRISNDPSYQEILLVTDKGSELHDSARHDERVRIVRRALEKDALNNVAIGNLRLASEKIGGPASTLQVTLRSYSTETFNGSLGLHVLGKGDVRFNPSNLKLNVKLDSGSSQNLDFSPIPEAVAYKVVLSPQPNQFDAISEDNFAQLGVQEQQEKVVLVTPLSAEKLGLKHLSVVNFVELHPSELTEQTYNDARFEGLPFLFHATLPETLPPVSAAFIDPPEGDGIFTVQKTISGREIPVSSWLQQHALTSYLNLPALKLSELSPIVPPSWAQPLIVTTDGTAAFAGEIEGRRYAALGFPLLPYRGRESPIFSVLTLNLIKWIAPFSGGSGYVQVPYALKEPKRLRLIDQEKDGNLNLLSKPGLYLPSDPSDTPIAVNFFSDAESDLQSLVQISYPPKFKGELKSPHGNLLRNLLLSLILALLLAELLISSRFIGIMRLWKAA